MAETVVGGADELRLNPTVACYVNVATSFRHNQEALQKLLFLADKGLPCIYVPQARRGLTGPATWAGSMALTNAGVLAGLVLSQLKREGAPIIFYGGAPNVDFKTLLCPYSAPHGKAAGAALAHYYNLPSFGQAGSSDSKVLDTQMGIDAALGTLTYALAGANLNHDVGYLEIGKTSSLQSLVICDDIIGWVKRFMEPLEINRETLALDLIEEVGLEGSFLDTEHTLRHFREVWYPALLDRRIYERWAQDGKLTLAERAGARVQEILDTYQPEPLADDVAKSVQAITLRAEASITNSAG
jgi:trimethylamine--corrinoid protein Co-methyltransferase